MHWWQRNNLRLIQTNLQETDADLDIDHLIRELKAFSANVLLLNTGGLMAFYPTELEYQYRSPFLKTDLIGNVLTRCHQEGIRFMARFDFSKAHESIYAQKPEWFYQSPNGQQINYNNMVHTCVNGGYQREYSLKILEEVLHRYDVDGIFFNMFGYQTRDYSHSYYGLCHCGNCQQRFQEMYGCELPLQEDPADPVYQTYQEFKLRTVRGMLDNIYELVKRHNPEIAISTYTDYKVDMVKKESNTAIHRPYPIWLYSASENVKSVEDSWDNKTISNVCINAVGINYRFMGVSKHQVAIRLYESLASGSGLDFCIIGVFKNYPDRENFEIVQDIYQFHKVHEHYFGQLRSLARVALIKPDDFPNQEQQGEYLGIFQMLKEEHILFDVICQKVLLEQGQKLSGYTFILVPDIRSFSGQDLDLLRKLAVQGVSIVATNLSFTESSQSENFLRDVFHATWHQKNIDARDSYLKVTNTTIFQHFQQREWIFLDGNFTCYANSGKPENAVSYLSAGRIGPPERCGGHVQTDFPGAVFHQQQHVIFPWQMGFLYYRYGYEDHKYLLLDVLDSLVKSYNPLETNAPTNVGIFFNQLPENGSGNPRYILQLLNLSGYNGKTFTKPNPISDIEVDLRNIEIRPDRVFSLFDNTSVGYEIRDNTLSMKIPTLKVYNAIIIE